MKIKKIHIVNFAGLKNKIINFKDGFNLIYGENESGKSSIENFIKIWLYGIHIDKKNRKKYMPLTGENISGELVLDYDGRGIIIKRVFGVIEENDICEIIDESTGKKINIGYPKEPGKSIFNINYSSFIRSLFIGRVDKNTFKCEDEIEAYTIINKDFQVKDDMELPSFKALEDLELSYVKYYEFLNEKNVKNDALNDLNIKKGELKDVLSLYNKLDTMGNNLYEKIYKLKIDQKNLGEKIKKYKINQDFINKTKREMVKKAASIDSIEFIGKYRNEIGILLESYKDGLKDLKYRIENQSKHKLDRNTKDAGKKIIITNIQFGILIILFVLGIIIKSIIISIVSIPIFLILMKRYFRYSIEIKNNKIAKKNNDLIQIAKNRVDDDEEEINIYMKETNCSSYEEFIEKITQYDKYISYKENCEVKLKKKEKEFNIDEMNSMQHIFKENDDLINLLYDILSCNDIDELLYRIKKYEDLKKDIENIDKEINRLKTEIEELNKKINIINKKITNGKINLGLNERIKEDEVLLKLNKLKNKAALSEAFDPIKKFIGEDFNKKVLNKFNRLTSKNFEKVLIDKNYKIKIYENGVVYNINRISSGSKNQLHLAISLSIAEMFFNNKRVPIFLENAFIEYDDIRRKKALNLLINEGFEQVIFFTCQRVEKNILDFIDAEYEYIKI